MTLIESKWLVYGETGVPVWLVLLGLIVVLYVAHRWLRVERLRRKGWMSACLPWTLTLILLLLAWVVWSPVLVRVQKWEQPGRVLAVVDGSASMKAPLGCRDLSAKLDMLSLWHPEACVERNQVARRLSGLLASSRDDIDRRRALLERLMAQGAQGIPPGSSDQAALEESRQWMRSLYDQLMQGTASVRDAVGSLSNTPEEVRQHAALFLQSLEKSIQPLSQAPEDKTLDPVVRTLDALSAGLSGSMLELNDIQNLIDEPFRQKQAAQLNPLLDEIVRRSREEAAMALAGQLPPGVAVVEQDGGDPQETDAYEMMQRALARHEGDTMSHLVLLSDGGHNGGPATTVIDRLKKEGIDFVAVGVGVPESTNADFAILDWRVPRVTRAERTVSLSVQVKTPPAARKPFTVKLTEGAVEAARGEWVSDGQARMSVALSWKTPAVGRHELKLVVESSDDAYPGNNAVTLVVDAVAKPPELMQVGVCPDWDSAYWRQSAGRSGMNLVQVFTEGKAPKRGGFSGAVPNTPDQWAKLHVVVLGGPAFAGFGGKDTEDLFRFVVEGGNTLVIAPDRSGGYQQALSSSFGWTTNVTPVTGGIRFAADARYYPLLRLGADGAQSARLFAAMGRSESVFRVPPQHRVLMESAGGDPICSLGFYGKGKVLFWGLGGLYRMREFEKAELANRLLDSVLGDMAAPLVAPAGAPAAFFPALPVRGVEATLVAPGTGSASATVDGLAAPVAMVAGVGNRLARVTLTNATVSVTVDGKKATAAVSDNPGMERIYFEFRESFLKQLARETDGRYFWAPDAVSVLRAIQPRTYRTASADVYPVGRYPAIVIVLLLLVTLHWVFRKLSGMAI